MRISTSALYDTNVNMLNQQQGKMLHTQHQLGSGRRLLTAADDPFAASRALEISQSDAANAQFSLNRNAAKHSTTMAEAILGSVTSLLQDVRTSAVGDGSGALTQPDKMALAIDLQSRLDELIGLANSSDGVGNFLFSGFQGTTLPFVDGPDGVKYVADDGQRFIQVESSRQLATSDPGSDVFMRIKNGNGKFNLESSSDNNGNGVLSQGIVSNPALLTGHDYTLKFYVEQLPDALKPDITYDVIDVTTGETLSECNEYESGQDISFDGVQFSITGEPADEDEFYVEPSRNVSIFETISDLIDALSSGDPKGGEAASAQYSNSLNKALNNIDRSMQNIATVRTSLGSRLRELDSLQATGDDINTQYKTKLSELQDVDFNKTVSDLNLQQTGLSAAQKSFKQVSDMTLFNYI